MLQLNFILQCFGNGSIFVQRCTDSLLNINLALFVFCYFFETIIYCVFILVGLLDEVSSHQFLS